MFINNSKSIKSNVGFTVVNYVKCLVHIFHCISNKIAKMVDIYSLLLIEHKYVIQKQAHSQMICEIQSTSISEPIRVYSIMS